ncbi:MAG: DUF3667 domain-containing protein [Muribaculaceae bacterium]|nr:DUF3667 domain-containing protein [Muribaculaceae bacterium]
MNLKEAYSKFKAWQQNPFDYTKHNTKSKTCVNCGTVFNDNFCPRCGQKFDVGPVNWEAVRQGVMLLWGMDTRSLSYSLLQLVLRPGYLIGDYISGKRQVSFPPVKMLFLVALAYMFLQYFFGEELHVAPTVNRGVWFAFVQWAKNNPAWGFIIMSAALLFPTWLFFRFSPLHTRHTLPQGFFIQVFMSTFMVLVTCFDFVLPTIFDLIIPIYYVIAYKQIFGYRWWGTLWRTILCFYGWYVSLLMIITPLDLIVKHHRDTGSYMAPVTTSLLIWFGCVILATVVPALLGYYISRHTARRRNQT